MYDILGADPNAELVRHYLIERTPAGYVRLKGCSNEPDFGMFLMKYISHRNKILICFLVNLSALVYQHTIAPLALPVKLVLPTSDFTEEYRSLINQQQEIRKMSAKDLLEKGAGKIK